MTPYQIRSTLYMPATQNKLAGIINNPHKTHADAIVLCFEDALPINDIDKGIANLNHAFAHISPPSHRPYVFIRVRNINNFHYLLNHLHSDCLRHLAGMVIPKLTLANFKEWQTALSAPQNPFYYMVTLETEDYYQPKNIAKIFKKLRQSPLAPRILSVRLGGNDLLRGILMKRPKGKHTLYNTPLVGLFSQIIIQARLNGFEVSAPVFEYFAPSDPDTQAAFAQELQQDHIFGFWGKTAIHPSQCPAINQQFTVSAEDLALAQRIYQQVAQHGGLHGGVSNHNQSMIEPTTHYAWAKRILAMQSSHSE